MKSSHNSLQEEIGVADLARSVWNQLRFGWTLSLSPSFSHEIPILFLGRCYVKTSCNGELKNGNSSLLNGNMEDFLRDFRSRLWFTYRENFPPITVSLRKSSFPFSLPPTSRASYYPSISPHHNGTFVSDTSGISASRPTGEIPLSIRTSDCGWGCMLRSAQMLFAQALIIRFLGREWTFEPSRISTRDPRVRLHRQIISWFADTPCSPLSIHRLVEASECPPGTLFGPAAVCKAFVVAMAAASEFALSSKLKVYLARDRVICSEDILGLFDQSHDTPKTDCTHRLTEHTRRYQPMDNTKNRHPPPTFSSLHSIETCTSTSGDLADSVFFNTLKANQSSSSSTTVTDGFSESRGLLLLLPMRLGAGNHIDPIYVPTLLRLLGDAAFVGLIGGRPRHSVYVAGAQADRLVYLDPHFCQDFVDVKQHHDTFNVSSWHCSTPRVMQAKKLDPSLAVGFYCGSRVELVHLLKRLPCISELRLSSSEANTCCHHLIEVVSAAEAQRLFCDPEKFPPSLQPHSPIVNSEDFPTA